VWGAPDIPPQLKFAQLRNGHPQGIPNASQSRFPSLLRCPSNLLEEVPAKRVVPMSNRAIRFADELRNDMEISYRSKEFCHRSEVLVNIDLLKGGLSKAFRVSLIVLAYHLFPVTGADPTASETAGSSV